MKLIIAGLGPGDFNLITVSALKHAENSDLILIPKSHKNNIQGVAENIIRNFVSDKKFMYVFFPMINDSKERNKIIHDQICNRRFVIIFDSGIFNRRTKTIFP